MIISTRNTFLAIITVLLMITSCTKDNDFSVITSNKILFQEDFNDAEDDTDFNLSGWTNFSEVGTKIWSEQSFSGNGYAEFSSFGSAQAVNVAWLVSPEINMDTQENEKLVFQSAQNFLRSRDNTLELLVASNYDGNNITSADWINIPIVTPTPETERYLFIPSGIVDLSAYNGKLHFAFRVKGSGTNNNLTGTYQIDNIRIFY